MNSEAMTGPATGPADARGRVGGSAEAASPVAPSLRQLTPPALLLLVVATGAWAGVVLLAREMGSMPGTMGLGAGSFAAVWALMMAAMMLPAAPLRDLKAQPALTLAQGRTATRRATTYRLGIGPPPLTAHPQTKEHTVAGKIRLRWG
jgi:hypothetical protein